MATPKKQASGNWRIQVFSHKENGKNKYVSFTAPTKAAANRLAAEFQENKLNESSPQNLTVKQAVDRYIEMRTSVVSPSTLRTYRGYAKHYTSLENIRLGSLTTANLQDYVNSISGRMTPKSVRSVYGLLISAISTFCSRNFKVTLPQSVSIERHIPTDADVVNLLNQASPALRKAILLSSTGTLRRCEVCGLKYKDVLYDFNAVYIHSDFIKGETEWIHRDKTKTYSSERRVILPKEVIDELGHGDPEEYIINILPNSITMEFGRLRNKLGLKCKFHDLRHYAASILHAIGVPDQYIMERGGWKNDKILKSVYRNTLRDKSSNFTSIANEYFTKNIISREISLEDKEAQQSS